MARATVGALALALAVALFLVLRDGEDGGDRPAAARTAAEATDADGRSADREQRRDRERRRRPEVPEIVVRGGEPVGGVQELSFTRGERIRFTVRSDVADHVHLHGYDVFMDIAAGGEVEFDVPARIEGVFEVELEDRVVPLAEITVNPG